MTRTDPKVEGYLVSVYTGDVVIHKGVLQDFSETAPCGSVRLSLDNRHLPESIILINIVVPVLFPIMKLAGSEVFAGYWCFV
jgi:hypothetical protein